MEILLQTIASLALGALLGIVTFGLWLLVRVGLFLWKEYRAEKRPTRLD